jgi:hypothetical protein
MRLGVGVSHFADDAPDALVKSRSPTQQQGFLSGKV